MIAKASKLQKSNCQLQLSALVWIGMRKEKYVFNIAAFFWLATALIDIFDGASVLGSVLPFYKKAASEWLFGNFLHDLRQLWKLL